MMKEIRNEHFDMFILFCLTMFFARALTVNTTGLSIHYEQKELFWLLKLVVHNYWEKIKFSKYQQNL